MLIAENTLRRIVRKYIILEKANDNNTVTLDTKLGKIEFYQDDKGVLFVTSAPGQDVSRDKPVRLPKDSSFYKKVKAEFGSRKKEVFDDPPDAGYPIIVGNNRGSKPVGEIVSAILKLGIEAIPDIVLKPGKKTEAFVDSVLRKIPDGHGYAIIIEPKTRKAIRIEFGPWDLSDGGNQECVSKNEADAQNIGRAVLAGFGFFVMGSIKHTEYGAVDMKLVGKEGNKHLMFTNPKKAYASFGLTGDQQVVTIPNCKFNEKAISFARSKNCINYSLLPSKIGATISSMVPDFFKNSENIESDKSKNKELENCSTFAYKLASIAKTGSSKNIPTSLVEKPGLIVGEASKSFGGTFIQGAM